MSINNKVDFEVIFNKEENDELTSVEWLEQAHTCILGVFSNYANIPESEKIFLDLASTLILKVCDNLRIDADCYGHKYKNSESKGIGYIATYEQIVIEGRDYHRGVTPCELLEYAKEDILVAIETIAFLPPEKVSKLYSACSIVEEIKESIEVGEFDEDE